MTGSVPRKGVGSGDWFALGSWVLGAVVGFVVAIQPGATEIVIIAACGGGLLIPSAVAWIAERLTGRRMGPIGRARGMGAIGTGVVALPGSERVDRRGSVRIDVSGQYAFVRDAPANVDGSSPIWYMPVRGRWSYEVDASFID